MLLGQGECDMPLGIIKTHLLHHMVYNQASSPRFYITFHLCCIFSSFGRSCAYK